MNRKKIIVISAGRSDYYRFFPIMREIKKSKKANVFVYPTQTYNNKKFGNIINEIKKNFNYLKNSKKKNFFKDTQEQMVTNFIEDLKFLSEHVKNIKPDIIIVIGDRYEMMLGPIVTIPKNIPLIHFFGGAITEGASVDELTRHAITKTSHFHFVLLNNYKKRLCQLGEEKWRIKTIGMPSLHRFESLNKNSLIQIGKKYNFDFLKPFVIVTFHPVTTELDKLKKQIKSLIQAIKLTNMNAVITYPNSDPKYDLIIQEYKKNF